MKKMRELRAELETQAAGDGDGKREELTRLSGELDALQGEEPLMRVCVDSQTVGEVISAWTGIPVGKMLKDEVSTVLDLRKHLERRVIGQPDALEAVAPAYRDLEGQPGRSQPPGGGFPAGGTERNRQDRDGAWRSPTCSTAGSAT